MSKAKALKPRPGRLLMGLPPDTRVVIADVTWHDYTRLVNAVAEGENCRVAFRRKGCRTHERRPRSRLVQ